MIPDLRILRMNSKDSTFVVLGTEKIVSYEFIYDSKLFDLDIFGFEFNETKNSFYVSFNNIN